MHMRQAKKLWLGNDTNSNNNSNDSKYCDLENVNPLFISFLESKTEFQELSPWFVREIIFLEDISKLTLTLSVFEFEELSSVW